MRLQVRVQIPRSTGVRPRSTALPPTARLLRHTSPLRSSLSIDILQKFDGCANLRRFLDERMWFFGLDGQQV
jgi:hypothetical protein